MNIDNSILKQIKEQAIRDYPEETCGLCTGSEENPDIADSIYPCENIQNKLHKDNPKKYPRTAVDGYYIDPDRFMEIDLKAQSEGRTINMIYHSHIDCGAYFSKEDQRMAAPLGEPSHLVVYMVISVINKEIGDIAYFKWNPEENKFCN